MSNEEKQPPRRPDLEVEKVRGGAWDDRAERGRVNLTLRITLKEVAERIQESREDVRDNRAGERRDDKRGPSKEDRRDRDSAPRYER